MGRAIGAVIAGAAFWAVLWIGGNAGMQAAFPDIISPDRPLTHLGILLTLIAYSAVLSVAAGYITAAVRGRPATGAVWSLALLQLALGIFFEASYWNLMPVWYHLVFLALLVPAVVWGGRIREAM